ncbi:ASCH domain-containing protein [Streptomyces kanasensis]|uniref:ASCH domain-containing protein n=1 Tax=Streptomyces kanasensis TaxID=936756 RepID=UPI0036F865FA
MSDVTHLPPYLLAFPGPLRDRLVAAVLTGAKTATTGLLAAYEAEDEPLPTAGTRSALIDSGGRPVAVVEVTEVRVLPLGGVDLRHAVDEGEGHRSVAEWRAAHEGFWHGGELRELLGDPAFTVDDTTPVVAERFRVVELLDPVAAAVAGELRLLEPSVRASRQEAGRLLDPEFTEVGASGRRWTREELLAALPDMPGGARGPRYEPSGMAGVLLAPGVVHLTYETVVEGRRAHRSSLWRRAADGSGAPWRLYHHQATPAAEGR